jgi:hypothetical protein
VQLEPQVTGTVQAWSVLPALPAGLAINATTGTISGTPTAVAAAATYTVSASNQGGMARFELPLEVAMLRATADRADERSGSQVHLVYVLATDSVDRALDTDGQLALSARAWNEWFASQAGGRRLRIDTFAGGNPDITLFRLHRTEKQIGVYGFGIREQIEYEMLAAGFDDPTKLYLAYYQGTTTTGCADTHWLPLTAGSVSTVFLDGHPWHQVPCSSYVPAAAVDQAARFEFESLRVVLLGLGFAPPCAPHQEFEGHVTDSAADLLYMGSQVWAPAAIDVGRDDYLDAQVPGCTDLAASSFIEPLPTNARPPTGWPYLNLAAQDCAREGSIRSPGTGAAVTIEFSNAQAGTIEVHRIDAAGARQLVRPLLPGEGFPAETFEGDGWIATRAGQCSAIFVAGARHGRAVVR